MYSEEMNARAERVEDHMMCFLVWLEGNFIHTSEVCREFIGDWLFTNPSRNVKV